MILAKYMSNVMLGRLSRNLSRAGALKNENHAIAYATHIVHVGRNIRRFFWNGCVFYLPAYAFNHASGLHESCTCRRRRHRLCNSKFPKWRRGVRARQRDHTESSRMRGRLVVEKETKGKEISREHDAPFSRLY